MTEARVMVTVPNEVEHEMKGVSEKTREALEEIVRPQNISSPGRIVGSDTFINMIMVSEDQLPLVEEVAQSFHWKITVRLIPAGRLLM